MRNVFLICFACMASNISSNAARAIEPITLVLEATSAAVSVAEFAGFFDSLDPNISKLLNVDLKTGASLFKQAKRTNGDAEELVASARVHFTRASEIYSDAETVAERNKKAIALLGLWTCCNFTGDSTNATASLKEIAKISVVPVRGQSYGDNCADYMSLISIVDGASKKLRPGIRYPKAIYGTWKEKRDIGSAKHRFSTGGKLVIIPPLDAIRSTGTYKFIGEDKLKIATEGLFYGINTRTWSFQRFGDVIVLKKPSSDFILILTK